MTRRIFIFASLLTSVSWLALAAPLLSQSVPSRQVESLQAGFEHPPKAAKVRCYWWWLNGNTTADTITRDLEGMKAKGYAGAILVDADGSGSQGNLEVPVGPAIGSAQWIALFVHALDVAQKLGLQISLNVTSRWDVGVIGGSTVTPEDALKLLTYSRQIVTGGGRRRLRLASPPSENGFYQSIAVLAYPLHHGAALAGSAGSARRAIVNLRAKTASIETGFSMPASKSVAEELPSVAGEQDADVSEVVDLSGHLGAKGTLEWTFPPGVWEILEIGYTDTAKHLTDYKGTPLGLPLDALSARAFDDYWRQAISPLLVAAKPYLGTSLRYLVTDSWEAGGANWTENFREEFLRRRGYDPVFYLPIVAGRILSSRDESNRFLFDLRRTVADLITENYYDRFAEHARAVGLGTHPESGGPHGAPIDALETFRDSSFPQTEFWAASNYHRVTDSDRFFVKEASSAAHIYGKPFVAAEGPTSMARAAWSESPGQNVQPTFDHALTEGLNHLFWHEFTSSPASYGMPGEEYFAGTHLNPNVTWWREAGPFLLALNRAQFLLQQGQPVSDILYFYGDQVPNFARLKASDPAQVLPGYDYDVTDADALLRRMRFKGADLHTPEGIRYRALALPSSRELSLPELQWVARFVHQGGVVIGLKPSGPLGIVPKQQQTLYAQLADQMWSDCDHGRTEAGYGGGKIFCTTRSRDALTSLHIVPDFSYELNSEDQGKEGSSSAAGVFDYVHRTTPRAEIYFVRNTLNQSVAGTLCFRVHGRAPELWLPDNGSTKAALIYSETKDERTKIPLTFPAKGSIFIVFERPESEHVTEMWRDGSEVFPSAREGVGVFAANDGGLVASDAGSYRAILSNGRTKRFTIAAPASAPSFAPWTLSFPAGWGAPLSMPVLSFQSWTASGNPNVRYFSGTATYHTTLQVGRDLMTPQHELWLNLGDVREIATVKVNGVAVQTLWRAPFVARIDRQLHAGENTLDIEVTNLWPNRLIGDLQETATVHYTHTNIRAYRKDSPLFPSGILEPATLKRLSVEAIR
ncbi:MAG: glycosyl hydrolase [Acidobacteriaceae bacterium]